MQHPLHRKLLIFWALAISVVCIAAISISPVIKNNMDQQALALVAKKAKTVKNFSGTYPVNVTYKEDFIKGTEEVVQQIVVDRKTYTLEVLNTKTEIKTGMYTVEGILNNRSNVATVDVIKFAGEASSSGGTDRSAETTSTVKDKKSGQKNVAVFLIDYTHTAIQPFYPSTVNQLMFGNGAFKKYFNEVSYGRQIISGDVFGWFTLANTTGAECLVNPETDLAPIIENNPIELSAYTNVVIITLCNGATSYGISNTGPQPYTIGDTTYTTTMTWINTSAQTWNTPSYQMTESMAGDHVLTNLEHLLIHEFGHALGLYHAHGLKCTGILPTETCEHQGLGNYFNAMAYNTIGLHLSVWQKAALNWFTSSELKTITQSGIYTVSSLETAPTNTITGTVKGYTIKPSVNSTKTPLWIEYRKAVGFDAGIATPALGGTQGGGGEVPPYGISDNQSGIFIYKEGFDNLYAGQINPKTADLVYLRNAPNLGATANPYQVSMNPGQTYSEPRYGLSITTLPPLVTNTARFQVTMDQNFACTRLAPTLSGSVSGSTTVTAGSAVSLKITLKNMDYLSCPNSSFTSAFDFGSLEQNGSNSGLQNFLSNLMPDDERSFIVGVWVPVGTAGGTYPVSATLTNPSSGLSSTVTVPITVQ